jgi:hypothetical protein
MNRFATTLLCLVCLIGWIASMSTPIASAADKPALADEIRKVIDAEGLEAAKKRFAELYPSQKDDYTVDMQSFVQLSTEYMQAGDMETAGALMEMTAPLIQSMMADSMNPQANAMAQEMAKAEREGKAQKAQEGMKREQEQTSRREAESQGRGEARDDLERFVGLYGDPADEGRTRTLFVTRSCDGYLVAGPNWADTSPWWMNSTADKAFTYSDSFQSLSMEFETSADGSVRNMLHDVNGVDSPLERLGPLPDDWPDCQERPKR